MGILAASNVPVVILLAGRAPTLAAETVPDEILEPFKLVRFAPEPLKVVAVTIPPEAVIPVPTFNVDVVVIPDTFK